MKIIHTIYSSHLTNDTIPEGELRAAADRLAELSKELIKAEYPESEVEIIVRHGVSGVGAGTKVFDDESDGADIADRLDSLIDARANDWNDKIWE